MFGLSLSHLLLLAAIALIVIGPKQLPEVARMLARFLNELKRTKNELTHSWREPLVSEAQKLKPASEPEQKPQPVADPTHEQ
jgi:Sec-independent protein translocase protein TatA